MTNLPSTLIKFVRTQGLVLLPVIFILLFGLGYSFFYFANIEPVLRVRGVLVSELTNERKALAARTAMPPENPQALQSRLKAAQATLTAVISSSMTNADANKIIPILYRTAKECGVTIVLFQSQNPKMSAPTATATRPKPTATMLPSPTLTGTLQTPLPRPPTQAPSTPASSPSPVAAVISVVTVRVQAQGTSHQLINFVSKLRDRLTKGAKVSNLNLTGGDGTATLMMDITLYVNSLDPSSVSAGGSPNPVATQSTTRPLAITGTSAPTPIPVPPSGTPTPPSSKYTLYSVRQGDTLQSIAQRFNTSPDVILAANMLSDSNIIAGQQLLVPVH